MRLTLILIVSSALFSAGFGAAAAVAVDDEPDTGPPSSATVTIPGANSVYTGTLTVRELEMFTVTRPTTTTTAGPPGEDVTVTVTERQLVQVPGPRGLRGPRGFQGPPGPQCPAGYVGQPELVNSPGGQEMWFVCVQQ